MHAVGALVAALAAAAASHAGPGQPPPSAYLAHPAAQLLRAETATASETSRPRASCAARRPHAGVVERRLEPVACEQPPLANGLPALPKTASAVAALLGS